MNTIKNILGSALILVLSGSVLHADYSKGDVMLQLYGGGASVSGKYHQPGVHEDEQAYADGGGMVGGQFLYYLGGNPCWALGVDVSHAGLDEHISDQLLTNRRTKSSMKATAGLLIARLAYPKGRWRPYLQGGLGVHHTKLHLEGTPALGTIWGDTGTAETRTLLDDGRAGPALSGAIGLHVYLTERFFIGAEYRVLDLMRKDFSPTAAGLNEGLITTRGAVSETAVGFMLGFGF
jgi:opacity protein-like surface antigen